MLNITRRQYRDFSYRSELCFPATGPYTATQVIGIDDALRLFVSKLKG
jgi:hypothetical protein